ncbi:uncharacterized protein LOC122498113 [Leptopilina heterotoma]|uniref:uncharacterized protein LOC122498113 n=1 Tax=Leptopilina heterotoma TaxID=63436 RepID=UPI001CA8E2D3|nr:uncharacterized protein LOC122498113 [Leptopilina heterotoma]
MTVTIVFSAFELLSHASLIVLLKSTLMLIAACLRLFLTSWTADDLKNQSEKIADSIYESSWINKSSKIRSYLSIVIIRSQKPLVISNSFCLEYYSFVSTIKIEVPDLITSPCISECLRASGELLDPGPQLIKLPLINIRFLIIM